MRKEGKRGEKEGKRRKKKEKGKEKKEGTCWQKPDLAGLVSRGIVEGDAVGWVINLRKIKDK